MKTDIEELKRLAEAATPGPWEYDHGCIANNGKAIISEYFVLLEGDDVSIAANIIDPKSCRPSKSNAAYIAAANPAAVLELIAEVERVTKQRDELLAAAKQAVDCIAYAIYNLADKKLEELPASIIDSTDPVYSGLIAEKVMRAAIAGAEG